MGLGGMLWNKGRGRPAGALPQADHRSTLVSLSVSVGGV